jgi:transposase, IS5 family
MRKVMEKQLKLGQVDICNIPIALQCRDEIPQVLLGLQAIYSNREVRDKVHDIANNHKVIREFMGHTIFEFDQRYGLQTIKDNVSLLTPQIMDRINRVVVEYGHAIIGHCDCESLKGRCDSFVLESTCISRPTSILFGMPFVK